MSFHRKVGEKDHLFGSVTTSDIAEALERKGFNIDRRKLQLNEPIKSLGEFEVPVRLHRDVVEQDQSYGGKRSRSVGRIQIAKIAK